jgi:exosome complex component RRP42
MDAMDTVKTNHIRGLISKGIREDGRALMDFRKIKLASGFMQNAEGSAQVELGETKVLAGIKLDVEEPMEDTPDRGNLMVSAELLPIASGSFETGPPSPASVEFARVVDRGIRAGNCVDLPSLLIEEEKCWTVFIDLYVLNYDGNLFDAGALAAMAALTSTRVPKYEDGAAIRTGASTQLKIGNIVTSSTFSKIKSRTVLDANGDESAASDCRMTITTDEEKVRAMQKGLSGGFFKGEVEELVDTAFIKNKELRDILKRKAE